MDLDDPVTVALLTMRFLRECGQAHALYGGLLVAAYGEARETRDADLAVLQADPGPLLHAFRHQGMRARTTFDGVVYGGLILSRIGLLGDATTSGVNSIDLVAPRSPRFAQAVLDRSLDSTLRGDPVRVVSPEDFVLLKVLSTRDRDLEDAATVLRRMADDLDLDLVAREVASLGAELPDVAVAKRWLAVQGRP